jgi:hypothetical protein
MLALAWAWLDDRKWLTVLLAAALLLTRQDSALWLLLLSLEVWRRRRAFPRREAMGAILLTSPWFVFAWWRYGSILPNSAQAKIGQNELMSVGGQSPFWRMLWETSIAGLNPAIVGLSLAALLLGIWVIVRFARTLWWLVAWTILYIALYAWLGVASFPWYFVPPLTAVTLIMAVGFGYLLGDTQKENKGPDYKMKHPVARKLLPAVISLVLALLLLDRATHMWTLRARQGHRPAYVAVGRWLAANASAAEEVASIEIGVIGYLSRRPILDTMGLVSPDMTEHQVGWVETVVYALNVHQPDYAVVLPDTAWDWIVDKWWFQKHYGLVARFDEVGLYQRQAAPDELAELSFQIDYIDGLALTGAKVSDLMIQPGELLETWLQADVRSVPPARYLFTLFLMDTQTYERFAGVTGEPFDGYYGTSRWQAGDQLSLPVRLEVPDDLQPGTYRLGIIIYDMEREIELPLVDQPHVPNPDVRVGWFRLGSPTEPPRWPELTAAPHQVQWQNGIELTRLALPSHPPAPGQVLPVQFEWQTSQPLSRDLTVFVHLTDAQDQIVAQTDRRPFHGRWPTPVWQPSEVLRDTYEIALPDTLLAGRYGLRFGFYDQNGRVILADRDSDYGLILNAVKVVEQP